MISDDVTVHKEEMEVLLSKSTQETDISGVMSGIAARYSSLVTAVNSRLTLLKKSVEVHELYCDNYRRCQEMIASALQQLQQIQDGAWEGIASVQQQMDRLKVYVSFSLIVSDSLIMPTASGRGTLDDAVIHLFGCPSVCPSNAHKLNHY